MAKPIVELYNSFEDWRVMTNTISNNVGDPLTVSPDQTFAVTDVVSVLNDIYTKKFNRSGGDITGDISVNTNKFNITAASGNTTIAGTLGVLSNLAINTNKFNVAALSGNTTIAGTLGVTGATTLTGLFTTNGDLHVGASKVTMLSATGNTAIAGTLSVAGITSLAITSTTSLNASGACLFSSTLGVTGDVAINTNKFNITAASGNTSIAGTLGVAGTTTLSSSLISTVGILSTNTPILSASQTWNNAGTVFNGIYVDVTNTASAPGSRLLSFKLAGVDKFNIDVNGAINQSLAGTYLARKILSGSRGVREYQDLLDDGIQGLPGSPGIETDSFEWGFTWNAAWDNSTHTYIKDRSNAGDHALMMRTSKKYTQDWWFSDGTTGGSAILWTNKVKFDLPNSAYTFAGTINTTTLNVSGNIQTGTWNATTISTTKGGTGRTTIGTANQFLGVDATATGLEYKTVTSSDSSLSIMYPSAGVIDIKLVGTLPGNTNFAGDLSVGGSAPNHKFLVLAASGNTDINGTLGVTGATTLSSTLGITGDVAININKFNVAALSGNTTIAGTLGVTGATILSSTLGVTGATTLSSTLNVVDSLSVNINKFNVAALSGNTTIAGTLGVTGATTLSSTLGVTGNVAINTNKFNITALSGNTTIAGTLDVASATTLSSTLNVVGAFSVNSNKFIVNPTTGNTTIAGTLGVTGKTTITDVSLNTLALNDGTGDATLMDVTSTSVAITGATAIATVPAAYKAVEFLVKCSVASAGAYQLIKLLAVNDGAATTAVTEFGNVEINDTGVSYDITSAGGIMSLIATTTIANSVFTVIATSIK